MRFHATVNVPQILSASVLAWLTILVVFAIFGDLTHRDITIGVAYIGGQATCLWVLWRGRDRRPADRSEP